MPVHGHRCGRGNFCANGCGKISGNVRAGAWRFGRAPFLGTDVRRTSSHSYLLQKTCFSVIIIIKKCVIAVTRVGTKNGVRVHTCTTNYNFFCVWYACGCGQSRHTLKVWFLAMISMTGENFISFAWLGLNSDYAPGTKIWILGEGFFTL